MKYKINSNAFKSIKVNFQQFFLPSGADFENQSLKYSWSHDVASFSPCKQ